MFAKSAKPATVAVYCRVSSDEQRERATINSQREYAERYLTLHDHLHLAECYLDDGYSGTLPLDQRPAGSRLLADAGAGKFSTVLVYKIDRLGRTARNVLTAIDDLEAVKVEVRSLTEPFDSSSPVGRMLLQLLAVFAEFERANIVERSVTGQDRVARAGGWIGGMAPFGYYLVGQGSARRLVPADRPLPSLGLSEAEVVGEVYRRAVEERQSCPQIAAWLNAIDVPTAYTRERKPKKGDSLPSGRWSTAKVRRLIMNCTYRGIHRWGKRTRLDKREVIERECPALVDAETWERAQIALKENLAYSPRNCKADYLLRGLMTCGTCGLKYVGFQRNRAGGRYTYYRCGGKGPERGRFGAEGRKCPSAQINADIERHVWTDIESFLRSPGETLDRLITQQDDQTKVAAQVRTQIACIEQRLGAMAEGRDEILTLYRTKRIDLAALNKQLDTIDADERLLMAQLAELRHQEVGIESAQAQLHAAANLLDNLKERLDQPLTFASKRHLVETLVSGIRVDTEDHDGKRVPVCHVTYCFGAPTTIHTPWAGRPWPRRGRARGRGWRSPPGSARAGRRRSRAGAAPRRSPSPRRRRCGG